MDKDIKYHFFDFDGTITNFQTPDFFVRYCLKSNNNNLRLIIYKSLKNKFINKLVSKLKFLKSIRKKIILKLLYNYHYNELIFLSENFYEQIIKPNIYPQSLRKILELKEHKNNSIILVSAGHSLYINHFANEHNIDIVIANQFLFKKGFFTGSIENQDCYGIEKVKRIKKYFRISDNITFLEKSSSYSDCMSDEPLFKFTENSFLIKDGKFY